MADELLGRTATSAGAVTFGKVAASGRVCLSEVQNSTTSGRLLEVWAVQSGIRHVPNSGRLSALRGSVFRDEVLGLWRTASHERLDCSRPCTCEAVAACSAVSYEDPLRSFVSY
jgi:hypothetical protein